MEAEKLYVFQMTHSLSHRNKRDVKVYSWLKNNADMHLITQSKLSAFKRHLKSVVDGENADNPRCKRMVVEIKANGEINERVSFDHGQIVGMIYPIKNYY